MHVGNLDDIGAGAPARTENIASGPRGALSRIGGDGRGLTQPAADRGGVRPFVGTLDGEARQRATPVQLSGVAASDAYKYTERMASR
jgi:hypothetical protein